MRSIASIIESARAVSALFTQIRLAGGLCSYSDVDLVGTDVLTEEGVAIKLIHHRKGRDMLEEEANTYRALSGGVGIPQVLWFGRQDDYYVSVHTLLGPSLENLLNYCGRRLSLTIAVTQTVRSWFRAGLLNGYGLLGEMGDDIMGGSV